MCANICNSRAEVEPLVRACAAATLPSASSPGVSRYHSATLRGVTFTFLSRLLRMSARPTPLPTAAVFEYRHVGAGVHAQRQGFPMAGFTIPLFSSSAPSSSPLAPADTVLNYLIDDSSAVTLLLLLVLRHLPPPLLLSPLHGN